MSSNVNDASFATAADKSVLGNSEKGEPVESSPILALKVVPRHIAIIMDGNGRWAKRRFLPRIEGHRNGAKSVRAVVEECRRLGVRYLTLFAFSTENWRRPQEEVGGLMGLFVQYLEGELELLLKHDIRLRAMGDLARLPQAVREILERNEQRTKDLTGMELILAVSYGGRDELVQAVKKIGRGIKAGEINPEDITEESFSKALYLPDVPDPDLLIRTSDETRISNFLLWQLAYSEIVVSPVLWPDFSRDEFHRCLNVFAGRNRRFGLTQEQIKGA
ncbi:MAG: isoprenyl transferase [Proteobacteria bacterium]|nr:isoprenyl transferase [Pseudomonadota bacterium]